MTRNTIESSRIILKVKMWSRELMITDVMQTMKGQIPQSTAQ